MTLTLLFVLAFAPPVPQEGPSLAEIAVRRLKETQTPREQTSPLPPEPETRAGEDSSQQNSAPSTAATKPPTFQLPSAAKEALKNSDPPSLGESVPPRTSNPAPSLPSKIKNQTSGTGGGVSVLAIPLVLATWWLALTILRLAYVVPGRAAGWYDPGKVYKIYRWWPWRNAYWLWVRFSWWKEELFETGRGPTARPASFLDTASALYRPGDIYLGRMRVMGLPGFQPVGLPDSDDRHLCMIAGSGSGKTVQEITIISLHEGPLFCIDPKRQAATVLARRMGQGGRGVVGKGMKLRILDPDDPNSAHWSPFPEIRLAAERAIAAGRDPLDAIVKFAQRIVDGLIVRYGDENPFWPGAARDFLLGLILFVYVTEPPERQTLARVYELLTVGLVEKVRSPKETGFKVLLFEMSENKSFGGIIAASAAGIREAGENTTGSVLITMREQLQFLKRPALRAISDRSDFYLHELTDNLALFVCANLTDIRKEFPGWFRLLTLMALAVFEDINRRLDRPCLFALDEMANLGKLEAVDTAASYMRSFGIRLFCIIQNINQLKEAGYKNWETFTGNAAAVLMMATKHSDNLAYAEGKLGKCKVREKLDGPPWWWRPFSKRITRHGLTDRDVMTADQAQRFMARGNMIVFRDQRAFFLRRDPYFKALPVWFYDPDPNFREGLRAYTRSLFLRWHSRAGS